MERDTENPLSIILTTVSSHSVAAELAKTLVEEKLCACVNIIPAIESIYFWQGSLCRENESVLIIKTAKEMVKKLEDRLRVIHPYEVPEFIVLDAASVAENYLLWVKQSVTT